MCVVHRWPLGAGFAALAVAVALLVAPLHGAGLSGSALVPHIASFGWYAYSPLPAYPTDAQLRGAGIVLPSDVLDQRRREAGGLAVVAVGLLAAGVLVRRRRSAGAPPVVAPSAQG